MSKKVSSPMSPDFSIPTRKTGGYDYSAPDFTKPQSQSESTIANHCCDDQIKPSRGAMNYEPSQTIPNAKRGKG